MLSEEHLKNIERIADKPTIFHKEAIVNALRALLADRSELEAETRRKTRHKGRLRIEGLAIDSIDTPKSLEECDKVYPTESLVNYWHCRMPKGHSGMCESGYKDKESEPPADPCDKLRAAAQEVPEPSDDRGDCTAGCGRMKLTRKPITHNDGTVGHLDYFKHTVCWYAKLREALEDK